MGYVMIARVYDEPLDSADSAIRGMDLVAASNGHFAQWEFVHDDGLPDTSRAYAHAPA
jgi:hypothetical protein